jgi:Zn-dependent peptidase ImmA (M78 family)/DNA-binding XRE family transcriptional regulator
MEEPFAYRLISARKMEGISLQGLADRLDNVVTKQSLGKYEQGKMKPGSEMIIKLANALNVPVDYFFANPSVKVELVDIDYRKFKTKLSNIELEAIEEKAKDIFERYFEIENIINLEEKNDYFEYKPVISTPEDAENAAKELREQWNLGYDPIPDVAKMLEDKGYKVVEIDAPEGFDGLKANSDNKKLIVLRKSNADDDIVRKRFTALHELAHHALKFKDGISQSEEERLCHTFASAILYPEDMAKRDLHKDRFHFYQNELQMIKERWGISFSAIFSRSLRLGIINDYVFKKLMIGYNKRKYNEPNKEPGRFLSKEKPVRFESLIYLALGKELISINEAAYYLGTSVWKFREQSHLML